MCQQYPKKLEKEIKWCRPDMQVKEADKHGQKPLYNRNCMENVNWPALKPIKAYRKSQKYPKCKDLKE